MLHVPLKSLILAIEGNEKSKILPLAPRKGLFLHLKAIIVGEGEQSTHREYIYIYIYIIVVMLLTKVSYLKLKAIRKQFFFQ